MGAKNSKKKNQDNKSVSSVYEHSLSSNSDKNKELQQNKDNRQDIINEFKEEIEIPRENESTESPEILFNINQENKIKNIFENNEDDDEYNEVILNKFFPEDLFNYKRSKTFVPKPVILDTPRLHSKASDNMQMSPFKLSMKSYGISPKWNQKPNKILLDFQKDIIDSNSCNDQEELLDEYNLTFADTEERSTPNPEDLLELLKCRKKMIKFRNSINYSPYHEYENILDVDDILSNMQNNNTEIHHSKKKSIWDKHIKYQLNKEKDKNKNSILNDESKQSEDENDDGLFILGILERASKERKRNKSMYVKK